MSTDKKIINTSRGVILHEGKMLLVNIVKNNFYCLPGGKIEFGEDPVDCLKRELVEELGVVPKIGKLLYINTFINQDNDECIDFIFEVLNGSDYLNLDEVERTHAFELSEIRWVDKNEKINILPKMLNSDFKNNNLLSTMVRFIKNI